jgi:hypothetical protein
MSSQETLCAAQWTEIRVISLTYIDRGPALRGFVPRLSTEPSAMLEQIDPRPEIPVMSHRFGLPTALSLAVLLIAVPATASAQRDTPDTENGRYSFSRVEDGHLRLDQRTGQVSVCTRRDIGWSCHPVPDERAALEEEIARLQRDNAALKKEMLARGITPPGGPATPPASADKPVLKVPSDAELDRAMATMERIWKRLVDMVQRWQRELTPI